MLCFVNPKNNKKLTGYTILNTRPLKQALPLAHAIEKEGGKCIIFPSFDIAPIASNPAQISPIQQSDFIIFFSQYAVEYGVKFVLPHQQIIAIGKSTATALTKAGVSSIIIPQEMSSEGLSALPELQQLEGKNIALFRGKSGRVLLDEILQQRGAKIQEILLYERQAISHEYDSIIELAQQKIDIALGMSVDSLTYFFSQLQSSERIQFLNVPWLVMSHRVANQAKKLGIKTIYMVSNGNILESLIQCSLFVKINC